jgi:hypothetical protein
VIGALLGLYYAADRFWKQVLREIQAGLKFAATEEGRLLRRKPAAK